MASLARFALVGVIFSAVAGRADAGIDFYRIFKTEYFTQTSNSAPASTSGYSGAVDLINSSPLDPTSGTVKFGSTTLSLSSSGGGFASYFQGFANQASLDAAFPNSTSYLFTSTSGSTNGQTGTLTTLGRDAFAPENPFFTGTTYSGAQGINAASGYTFTFNAFTQVPPINTPVTFFGLFDNTANVSVYGTSGPNTLTSASIAAGTLVSGHSYTVSVDFSNRFDTRGAGFAGTATSEVAYDQSVSFSFTTAAAVVPEPSSLLLSGLGVGLGFALRRARHAGLKA